MKNKNVWLGLLAALALAVTAAAQSSTNSNHKTGTKNGSAIQKSVRAYFDWQYDSAINGVRYADRLKPAVTLYQSQEFLQKKQELLEVAEFNDETNFVKVVEQDLDLEFQDAQFVGNDFAIIQVLENFRRRYGYSDEFVEGTYTHLIELRRNGRSWEIVSDRIEGTDAPPDDFNKDELIEEIRQESVFRGEAEQDFLQKAGITQEFLDHQAYALRSQGLSEKQSDERLKEIVNRRASDYLLQKEFVEGLSSFRLTNRSYNRQSAQNYINRWWDRRNSAWGTFDNLGGDCTNWVSQIINAGGIPEDESGTHEWFYNSMDDRAPSWTGVKELWTYLVGNSDGNGYNGPQANLWTDSTGRINMYTGDVIQLKKSSGWFHSFAVNKTEWVRPCFLCSWVLKIYVTSHDRNRKADDIDRSDVAGSYPTRRYANIVGWRAR